VGLADEYVGMSDVEVSIRPVANGAHAKVVIHRVTGARIANGTKTHQLWIAPLYVEHITIIYI
jgi:hypothetical protein